MKTFLLVIVWVGFFAVIFRHRFHFSPNFHWAKNKPQYIGRAPWYVGGAIAVDKCSVCGKETVY